MKCLTIIVHTDDQHELTRRLREFDDSQGFTLHHVEGHGIGLESDAFMAAVNQATGAAPRVRADIVLTDHAVAAVIENLRQAKADGGLATAYYWITAIEQEGHL